DVGAALLRRIQVTAQIARAELRRFVDRGFKNRRRLNPRKSDFRISSTLDFHAFQRQCFRVENIQMSWIGPCATFSTDYLREMHRISIELVNRRFDQSSIFAELV